MSAELWRHHKPKYEFHIKERQLIDTETQLHDQQYT